jgi:hypothetical protein
VRLLFFKILTGLLLFSFTAETTILLFNNSELICLQAENDKSEKKQGENKSEKEDDKDKIVLFTSNIMVRNNAEFQNNRNHTFITTAYLSLPEIPPNRV